MSARAAACIAIPCYRAEMLAHETIALERCVDVLAAHPKILVAPQSLDLEPLLVRHPDLRVERFADEFFSGIAGYNRLMLSDEFYARFEQYDFMLVHQLDCFVFSDQLLNWCAKGYDYVGAPWLPPGATPNFLQDVRNATRRARARRENKDFSLQYFYGVGNGGFSLRRITAMRRTLRELQSQAAEYRLQNTALCNEDLFFSIEANRFSQHLRLPSYKVASKFAWETEPSKAAAMNRGRLPFGCHGWNKLHREEWRPVFAQLGYSIDAVLDLDTR
jgi:Protein of unknown function (DUF5672)